jgi:hypothetical protein
MTIRSHVAARQGHTDSVKGCNRAYGIAVVVGWRNIRGHLHSRQTFHVSVRPYCNYSLYVKVTLRPTVSRPTHLGTRDQFFFFFEIFFRQLRVCYFVAHSLTRRRVCNLLLLLVLASAVPLGSALSDDRSGLSFVSLVSISL